MMKMSNKIGLAFVLLMPLLGLTGCYPFLYHAPLEQGNVINPNAVALLKVGMTKDQVLSTMGTPILDTPLSPDVWHYVYTLRLKDKLTEQKQLTLYFSENKLARIAS
ncbi:MAG TPA: outer membrane protein assembly factor BamE [Gammaproteobacteria bacterium]|nr:outer membrane protein assembly factor BamE [Gammaproteobacteria bacterium]